MRRLCVLCALALWAGGGNAYPCDGRSFLIADGNPQQKFCKNVESAWSGGFWAAKRGCNPPGSTAVYGTCQCDTVDEPYSRCGCSWCLKDETGCTGCPSDKNQRSVANSCGCSDYRTCSDTRCECLAGYYFSGTPSRFLRPFHKLVCRSL